MAAEQVLWIVLVLGMMHAQLGSAACVEVDSDTEAVAGEVFKLGCISCKIRGEVRATGPVEWWFTSQGETNQSQIYTYDNKMGVVTDERFMGRLQWVGSKNTTDVQDGSLNILNVTFNDMGTYQCFFYRTFTYKFDQVYHKKTNKTISMTVVAKETRGMASILSEVMMYVSIIGLQLWLLVEMVYCYRKIATAGEEALRESTAEYLAITPVAE